MKNDLLPSKFSCNEEVIRHLKNATGVYREFLVMNDEWKQRFMDFCTGKKTLPILYDDFFKVIFKPDIHPERLSSLISSMVGEELRVKKILPLEDWCMDGESMVVMDILVETQDCSLANVEVQKIPYLFPGERISCYSSDMVMRQYSRIKGEKGKKFSYKDLKKVYTIVIYEKTEGCFHKIPECYVHRGKVKFNTGLELELLQEYCLVALDVFQNISYHKDKDILTGWLSFLTTESIEDAERLIVDYPWLLEIYREIASYREKPEEVLSMFSRMLHELDRNTMQYMIDEQKKEIEERDKQIEERDKQIEEALQEVERLKKKLEEKQ